MNEEIDQDLENDGGAAQISEGAERIRQQLLLTAAELTGPKSGVPLKDTLIGLMTGASMILAGTIATLKHLVPEVTVNMCLYPIMEDIKRQVEFVEVSRGQDKTEDVLRQDAKES